jgi:hypothetical protein
MRLWKLQDLFDQAQKQYPDCDLIHVCVKCGWKTPAPARFILSAKEANINHTPKKVEIEENYCDECNHNVWRKIADHNDYLKNNCEHCGGGRCRHYSWDET